MNAIPEDTVAGHVDLPIGVHEVVAVPLFHHCWQHLGFDLAVLDVNLSHYQSVVPVQHEQRRFAVVCDVLDMEVGPAHIGTPERGNIVDSAFGTSIFVEGDSTGPLRHCEILALHKERTGEVVRLMIAQNLHNLFASDREQLEISDEKHILLTRDELAELDIGSVVGEVPQPHQPQCSIGFGLQHQHRGVLESHVHTVVGDQCVDDGLSALAESSADVHVLEFVDHGLAGTRGLHVVETEGGEQQPGRLLFAQVLHVEQPLVVGVPFDIAFVHVFEGEVRVVQLCVLSDADAHRLHVALRVDVNHRNRQADEPHNPDDAFKHHQQQFKQRSHSQRISILVYNSSKQGGSKGSTYIFELAKPGKQWAQRIQISVKVLQPRILFQQCLQLILISKLFENSLYNPIPTIQKSQ